MRCVFPLTAVYNPAVGGRLRFIPRSKPEDVCMSFESCYQFAKPGTLFDEKLIKIRCGKCVCCKITKAEEWSVRCVHEASQHRHNMFVTLTYSPDNAPNVDPEAYSVGSERATASERARKNDILRGSRDLPYTLYYPDFQAFMKRLRRHAEYHYGVEASREISYLVCGEYMKNGLPHYHAIIFGLRMQDMRPVGRSKKLRYHNNRYKLYGSETLEKLWGHGFITIGEVNEHTAAYVAQYTLKKQRDGESNCKSYEDHFEIYNRHQPLMTKINRTEYYEDFRRKEFIRSSLKKPIGYSWIKQPQHIADIYVRGNDTVLFVNAKGRLRRIRPPRFYDRYCEKYFPRLWEEVKKARTQRVEEQSPPTYAMYVSAFNIQNYKISSKRDCRNFM